MLKDEQSFELLFRSLYTSLCRTIYKIVKDKDVSEDIAQDAFFILWDKRDEITISAKSYLYRIAINRSFNYIQKNNRYVETRDGDLTEFAPAENLTEHLVDLAFAEKEIDRILDTIPPACRSIFLMSRMDGMSYKEIADAMQISVKTVENQMSKALRILREKLNPALAVIFFSLLKIF